ncbi:MAG: hypothetical protein ABR595_06310 [Psychroflexus sp.]
MLVLTACKNEISSKESGSDSEKLYVSSVTDVNTQEPFHEVMFQRENELYKYDLWSKDTAYSETEIEKLRHQDSILFSNEDKLFFVEAYSLYKDFVLFYDNTHLQSFVEISKGQELDKEEFTSLAEGNQFSTEIPKLKTPNSAFEIQEFISFQNQEITFLWEYYYAEKLTHTETETVPYQLFEVENQLFIVPSTQDNPYPIYHVRSAEKNTIELTYFTDFEPITKTYSATNSTLKNSTSNYSLCRDGYQSIYYVGEDVRYAKGLEHLKTYLDSDAPTAKNEGYINLHFTINCEGEVGRFGLELLNKDYKPTDFNPELIQHVIEKVREVNDWDDLDLVSHRGASDVRMFFLIKIRNQKIVDVCP